MSDAKSEKNGANSVLVAFAFGVVMLGTTLPTALYPLYEGSFDLAPLLTPVIFASYAIGVVGALLLLGYLSDEVGRRRMMLPALGLSALSAVVFLLANGLALLLVGRVLSGLSSGIAMGACTAWLVDLAGKENEQRATLIGVAANVGGLACGPVLGGLLARFAPAPLRLPFAVDLLLLVPATVGLFFARETVRKTKPHLHFRLQRMKVPTDARAAFWRGAVAGVCAFAVAGVFCAIAPAFLGKELQDKSPAHAGLLVGSFFFSAALGQFTIGLLPKRAGLALGCGVLVCGLGLLALAIGSRSSALLFVSAAVSGLGQGLAVGFGLADINQRISGKRSETDSGYFVLLYSGVAVPTVGVGLAVTFLGMPNTAFVFCAVVATCVVGVALTLLFAQDDEPAPSKG